MDFGLPDDLRENGGFPEPLDSAPVRVVAARHDGCGARTRVRLPAAVPAEAVRRVRCSGCDAAYETKAVEEIALELVEEIDTTALEVAGPPVFDTVAAKEADEGSPKERRLIGRLRRPPRPGRPRLLRGHGRLWRWLSVPVGAAAVLGALLLLQGGDATPDSGANGASSAARNGSAAAGGGGDASGSEAGSKARLVRGSQFAMALPGGWERTQAQGGATFAASSADGDADATLWIERAPNLGLDAFETRSLDQLRSLAGSARVVERVAAPTMEGTIIRLAADAPEGEPRLEVTLRAAGPYRYYLATTLQPDASRGAIDGVEVVHGSFTPEPEGAR